jgi:3-oxoacyl-[acyl-carrier protein] reductase
VLRAWGRLDILVNNAAVAAVEPLASAGEATFERLFAVNVRGTFFAMQEAARCMGAGGRIINISSSVTAVGSAGLALYGGTKGAVEQFTLAAARELGPRGITVNTVSPGLTRTAMLADVVPVAAQEQLVAATPLNRLGEPEDIAAVVAYLAGPDAAWLTGQNIRANGGL